MIIIIMIIRGQGISGPILIFKTLCFTDAFRRKLCRYFTIALALVSVVARQFQFILMSRLSSFRLACSRRSNNRARRSDGGDPERVKLYIAKTGGKNEGRFVFFFVNFSPALYNLNTWNRLRLNCLTEYCSFNATFFVVIFSIRASLTL